MFNVIWYPVTKERLLPKALVSKIYHSQVTELIDFPVSGRSYCYQMKTIEAFSWANFALCEDHVPSSSHSLF
jgi:hypothetical protein